ncbi:MAG: S53 family peptidase, partial [Acidimicrobiales bacterium]
GLFQRAASAGVTVLAASGDHGSAQGGGPTPTVQFPASSPWVTSVGGTTLSATVTGKYQGEVAWNSAAGASGGGVSQIEGEPAYQRCLPAGGQTLLHGFRGVPDVAMNADWNTPVPIYMSLPGSIGGYVTVGGTSEGSPVWAGIAADLDQLAGRSLGFLNPLLYRSGCAGGLANVMHDITVGTNAWGGVPGYVATPGWDPVTGWGSPLSPASLPSLQR